MPDNRCRGLQRTVGLQGARAALGARTAAPARPGSFPRAKHPPSPRTALGQRPAALLGALLPGRESTQTRNPETGTWGRAHGPAGSCRNPSKASAQPAPLTPREELSRPARGQPGGGSETGPNPLTHLGRGTGGRRCEPHTALRLPRCSPGPFNLRGKARSPPSGSDVSASPPPRKQAWSAVLRLPLPWARRKPRRPLRWREELRPWATGNGARGLRSSCRQGRWEL